MAITEIPPKGSRYEGRPAPPRSYREPNSRPDWRPARQYEAPILLLQLQDELARARKREALWISLFVHLLFVVLIFNSPRFMPRRPILIVSPQDLLRTRELTYLEMAPDQQKPPARPPNTNIISDKNRIATSRQPTIDRKTLEELRDSRRPGAPGPGGIPAPQTPPAAGAQSAPPAQPAQPAPQPQAQNQGQVARLESPMPKPRGGGFGQVLSPGSQIAQAAQAAAANRGGYGGASGDYGLGPNQGQGQIESNLDILSDTMGVDFGPYLSRVLHDVRVNWYILIPEVARSPLMKKGKVSIEFAILKDGKIAGMRLVSPSGDSSLDRAAWGGITASNPFPPLPAQFGGQYLALRFHFYYNPDKSDLQ